MSKKDPYAKFRNKDGIVPGSIGDISMRLGQDVRELIMAGYTDAQIQALLKKREEEQKAREEASE